MIRAEGGNILRRAHRLFDLRSFAGREVKRQAHDFEWQEQVRKNNRCVDLQDLCGFDRHLGSDLRFLADLNQGVVLADCPVLGHVAPRLAHEPDRRALGGLRFRGSYKEGIGGRHDLPM